MSLAQMDRHPDHFDTR